MPIVSDLSQIDKLRDFAIAINTVQMNDRDYLRYLKSWLGYNPHDAIMKGYEVFRATSSNPNLSSWLGAIMVELTFTA